MEPWAHLPEAQGTPGLLRKTNLYPGDTGPTQAPPFPFPAPSCPLGNKLRDMASSFPDKGHCLDHMTPEGSSTHCRALGSYLRSCLSLPHFHRRQKMNELPQDGPSQNGKTLAPGTMRWVTPYPTRLEPLSQTSGKCHVAHGRRERGQEEVWNKDSMEKEKPGGALRSELNSLIQNAFF